MISQQTRKVLVYNSTMEKQNTVVWGMWSEDGLHTLYCNFQANDLSSESCSCVADYKVSLTFTILK